MTEPTDRDREMAATLSPCTCYPPLRSGHYANCPSENQEGIAEALTHARAEERERCARVCEDLLIELGRKAEEYAMSGAEFSEGVSVAGAKAAKACAKAIRALGSRGEGRL